MATVVNIAKDKYNTQIMRGSRYGNPVPISRTCSRKRAIDSFEDYFVFNIKSGEVTFEELVKLNSAILGCCCKPQACHGDVIAKYAPKLMDASEIKAYLTEKHADLIASGNKGQIMKTIMPELKGKADGKVINQVVAELCK